MASETLRKCVDLRSRADFRSRALILLPVDLVSRTTRNEEVHRGCVGLKLGEDTRRLRRRAARGQAGRRSWLEAWAARGRRRPREISDCAVRWADGSVRRRWKAEHE